MHYEKTVIPHSVNETAALFAISDHRSARRRARCGLGFSMTCQMIPSLSATTRRIRQFDALDQVYEGKKRLPQVPDRGFGEEIGQNGTKTLDALSRSQSWMRGESRSPAR